MESTRKKLIAFLKQSENTFISGQELSNHLHVSRTAVWKHMKELEKDGYQIEAIPRKGYRIKQSPVKVSANTIQWGLETKWLGKEIIHRPSVTSTQTIAHQIATDGGKHGTVVIADRQTDGKGRLNRKWYSMDDDGVWMSLLLRPNILPQQAPQLTLAAATVVAEVLHTFTQVKPFIKWPNDIFFGNKKVSGILTEMQAEQDAIQYIVLGIGLNVNQTELPEEINNLATSMKIHTNTSYKITDIIQELLLKFEKCYDDFMLNGFPPVKEKWERYGLKVGEKVTVKTIHRNWETTILGIQSDGSLLVKNNDGKEEALYSAEIFW